MPHTNKYTKSVCFFLSHCLTYSENIFPRSEIGFDRVFSFSLSCFHQWSRFVAVKSKMIASAQIATIHRPKWKIGQNWFRLIDDESTFTHTTMRVNNLETNNVHTLHSIGTHAIQYKARKILTLLILTLYRLGKRNIRMMFGFFFFFYFLSFVDSCWNWMYGFNVEAFAREKCCIFAIRRFLSSPHSVSLHTIENVCCEQHVFLRPPANAPLLFW